MWLVLRLLWH